MNRWGKCTLRLSHGHENRQAAKLPFKFNCLWIQSESSFKNRMASVSSVLQILVKAIIKWSKDVCPSTPFLKLVPLGWFKFLFQKVLMQSFSKWLVWVAVTEKHLILHSMCRGFSLFVCCSIKCFTQLTWSQSFLKRTPFVLFRSEPSLCASSHSSSIQRDFEI